MRRRDIGTEDKKQLFLTELRRRYSVYHACQAAGVGRTTVYRWREEDEEFARAWDGALADAVDVLEASAYERAMQGDTTLTIFLLKGGKPEKYRERLDVGSEPGRPLKIELSQSDAAAAQRLLAGLAEADDSIGGGD